jgi:type IV pilus assembly protein PilY1
MLWLLGQKSTTDPDTDISTDQRWSVNDVLHSSPAVITYGGSDSDGDGVADTFFDKILYGTNDGVLHMVNGETGAEEWRYMPGDFWGQQQDIFANGQGDHIYGLDVTPTIQVIDTDLDGAIETTDGDQVIAYVAAR